MSKKEFSPKNILIVKLRALGDSIMGLSAIQYLKELYPESKIYYAMPSWITPLYNKVQTSADNIIPLDLKNPQDWFLCWRMLRKEKIDLIYEMHQAGRSRKFFSIYSKLSGIPYFFHNHHLKSKTQVLDQGAIKPLIQRDLDGIYSFLGKETIPSYKKYIPKITINQKIQRKKRVILGVVATRDTKMWPLKNYVELCNLILKNSNTEAIEIAIPLSKSETDQNIKNTLLALKIDDRINFVSESLENLPLFFAESFLYLGNDTGIKHLAIAVGITTYTFFGPEPPNEWHPYDSSLHPYFYIENQKCRTENAHYCGKHFCETMDCLKNISVEKVWNDIGKYFDQEPVL